MLQNAATQALIAQIMKAQRRAAPAEEAEPKAEQAPKGKAPPLAKPKSKPKPQPQAPHPQPPPPPPLVAWRRGAAAVPEEEEPEEVEEARGELKGFLGAAPPPKRPTQGRRRKSRPGRQNRPAYGRRERRSGGSARGRPPFARRS